MAARVGPPQKGRPSNGGTG